MTLTQQREFLIKLAPVWLACRWRVMGHGLIGKQWPKPDLANDLLGMHDYGWEMRLVCREQLAQIQSAAGACSIEQGQDEDSRRI